MADISRNEQNALKMQVATAMSQTLSFSMERKYIKGLGDSDINPLFKIKEVRATPKSPVTWISISQIGRPLDESSTEDCFTSIQKILHSCFLPQAAQLLFLITNDGIKNQMYLGIRPINRQINKRFVRQLSKFMMAQWPGLKCEMLSDEKQEQLKEYAEQNFRTNAIDNIYAFTGIPSMESQYKNIYPASIDRLMLGMNGCTDFAYLVVADPIDASEVDTMLFKCREMGGQAESLKSFNISEGVTAGITRSISNGTTWNHTDGTNSSVTGKDWTGAWNKIKGNAGLGLIVGGVAVAACAAFPPAAAAMGAIASGVSGVSLISAGNALIGLMGSKTTGESHSDNYGGSSSLTEGMSESQTETISHNVVNKHIEAVGEHLFYHSKRFESGKALGMWKVGAYLLTSDEKDALSGTMQLKAILSGQESIYEPIRVTNLTEADIEGFKIENSIAKLQSPNLYIQTLDNQNFEHPLGGRYKELKTVLTTKELSYLINFPLHSVPGISVVDSCPDFCLNAQAQSNGIEFGKLVNGGAETKIPYHISRNVLSRHSLVCGINGSGKTNTIQSILNGVGKLPFLVIEPAKTEYVDWAIEHNRLHPENPVAIYIPGCKKYRGNFEPERLHINPFDIIWFKESQEPNVLAPRLFHLNQK